MGWKLPGGHELLAGIQVNAGVCGQQHTYTFQSQDTHRTKGQREPTGGGMLYAVTAASSMCTGQFKIIIPPQLSCAPWTKGPTRWDPGPGTPQHPIPLDPLKQVGRSTCTYLHHTSTLYNQYTEMHWFFAVEFLHKVWVLHLELVVASSRLTVVNAL